MDFDDDTREPGQVGKLVAAKREKDKLTQEQIGKRAGMARSTVLAIENGHSHPSLAKCLDLARALGIPPRDILDARALDELRDNPERQRELAAELEGGSAWVEAAQLHMRVENALVDLELDEQGSLGIERYFRGCTTVRPLRKLVFRDTIVAGKPTQIEIQRVPIGYDTTSRTNGPWREHHIDFHEAWTEGTIDIRFRVNLHHAYALDVEEYLQQLKEEGLSPTPEQNLSFYHFYIPYAFERLTLNMAGPDSYSFEWSEPVATPDRAFLEDKNILPLSQLAQTVDWRPLPHRARLTLTRPRTGNSVYLVWKPRDVRSRTEDSPS